MPGKRRRAVDGLCPCCAMDPAVHIRPAWHVGLAFDGLTNLENWHIDLVRRASGGGHSRPSRFKRLPISMPASPTYIPYWGTGFEPARSVFRSHSQTRQDPNLAGRPRKWVFALTKSLHLQKKRRTRPHGHSCGPLVCSPSILR